MVKLKEYRVKAKLNQVEVAKILGIGQSTYSCYERGAYDTPANVLIKLADFYNTSVDKLVGRTKNYNVNTGLTDKQIALIKRIESVDDRVCDKVNIYLDGLLDK